jgi:hypothetical protein
MDRLFADPFDHLLIVDRRDCRLFSKLASGNRTVLAVEEILPPWIGRVPCSRRWWWSLRSWPVRGWILQQLAKLSAPDVTEADVLLYVDSDVVFIKPFDDRQLIGSGDQVSLLRYPGFSEGWVNWHRSTAHLLGLEATNFFGANYVGNLVRWRRENVIALREHIECTMAVDWRVALCRTLHWSEYTLYGVFVDQVLGADSGHFPDTTPYVAELWNPETGVPDIEQVFTRLSPDTVAVMISSRSNVQVDDYRRLVENCWNSARLSETVTSAS